MRLNIISNVLAKMSNAMGDVMLATEGDAKNLARKYSHHKVGEVTNGIFGHTED